MVRGLDIREALSGAPLATIAREVGDEADAIRAYIARERPHLLASYDMETLVELVRGHHAQGSEVPVALEHFRQV